MKPITHVRTKLSSIIDISMPLCLLGFACALLTSASEAETIRGRIKNGTPNGSPVSGITVTLQAFNAKGEAVEEAESKTDASGEFTLQAKASGAKVSYRQIFVSFQGVSFESVPFLVDASHPLKPIPITVYDTTSDASKLVIDMHHVMLKPKASDAGSSDSDIWTVREILALRNTGDKAYIGSKQDSSGKPRTVQFSLPAGYRDFKGEEGILDASAVKTDAAVYDSMQVPPGARSFAFAYQLPTKILRKGWTRKIDYPTQRAMVLAVGDDLHLSSRQLKEARTEEMGGKKMTFITGQNLKAGTVLTVNIQSPDLRDPDTSGPLMIGVVVGLCVIAGVAGTRLRTRRRVTPSGSKSPSRKSILDQIADLDDQREAGKIGEAEYQKKRAKLKGLLGKG